MLQIETIEAVNKRTSRKNRFSRDVLAFAQIKPAKINLSLFGRLALPKVEDERGAF